MLALFVGIAYRSVCPGYFLADDLSFLAFLDGEREHGTLFEALVRGFWRPPFRGEDYYRPLLDASFALDYLLWGTDAWGWHVTNLLLHLTTALLLAETVRELLRDTTARQSWAPEAAGAIFALSPLAPESVAWISGRSDLLALGAMLASLWLYLRSGERRGVAWLGSLGLFAVALTAKEVAVTLPAWVASLHLAGWRRDTRSLLRGVLPFAGILGAYFLLRSWIFGRLFAVHPVVAITEPGWFSLKAHALRVFVQGAAHAELAANVSAVLAVVLIAAGLGVALREKAARRLLLTALGWLGATLLPLAGYLSIAPSGENARLLYVPTAALALLLAVPLAASPAGAQRERAIWAVGGIAVVARLAVASTLLATSAGAWAHAGAAMSKVVPAVLQVADATPQGSRALLLLPDAIGPAIFSRNGLGVLMGPPVQPRSLEPSVLVMSTRTAPGHFERIAREDPEFRDHPRFCWHDGRERFVRLAAPPRALTDPRAVRRAAARAGCDSVARDG